MDVSQHFIYFCDQNSMKLLKKTTIKFPKISGNLISDAFSLKFIQIAHLTETSSSYCVHDLGLSYNISDVLHCY